MMDQDTEANQGGTFVSWSLYIIIPTHHFSRGPPDGSQTNPLIHPTQYPFSRLPAELRWKIWEYNLPGPRIVSIRCGLDSPSLSPGSSGPSGPNRSWHQRSLSRTSPLSAFATSSSSSSSSSSSPTSLAPNSSPSPPGCTSPAPIPANLHACHESRREALRRYHLSFGIARQPGQVIFDPARDVLYFGPRDGFMASEAQLRTVLSLCDPAELAQVRRIAVNDALFWVYESAGGGGVGGGGGGGGRGGGMRGGGGGGGGGRTEVALAHTTIACSLLIDVLQLLRARLPGLRELIFVPRDENPLYSGTCCLVEPAIVQSRLARQVREAMRVVFGLSSGHVGGGASEGGGGVPWSWRIMTLSADPDPPVYNRSVLGWEEEEASADANARPNGLVDGRNGRGLVDEAGQVRMLTKHWQGREFTRLSALQESVKRQFMQMEMDVCG